MNNSDFNDTLKAVSRSFYLSIRVLPRTMQKPVAIAYLLARAADAIADTSNIAEASRLASLLHFKKLLTDSKPEQLQSINTLSTLVESINHAGERELLTRLPAILTAYNTLPTDDHEAVKKVVNILTTGMEKDLRYFTSSSQIRALPDDKTLDEYTYYVAGCVGEFWTALSIIHINSLSSWQHDKQKEEILALGIRFGKALQLTNILRDISKDAKIGRCYLPASDLEAHALDTSMISDKNNNAHFKPVIEKWLSNADAHFDAAQTYLLSIPRSCLRLRLASLWPILIGLSTLKLIHEKQNFLDADINVKVNRKWVYKMLILSVPAAFSNTLLRYWIAKIRHVSPS